MLTLPLIRSTAVVASLIGITALTGVSSSCHAQPLHGSRTFTHQDTLRGSITPERAWWDVQQYIISVEPDFNTKTIKGSNTIFFKPTGKGKVMQIDLQEPMVIDKAFFHGIPLPLKRDGNVYYLTFEDDLPKKEQSIRIEFSGKPREAVNPPWDGGWIWKKDKNGNPWMSVACQGLGASVWFPCKDHQSDEPDNGAMLEIITPADLVGVGNGRLLAEHKMGTNKKVFKWAVRNPINSYNIIPYIGKYVHFGEVYFGEQGPLDCDYYVLDYNLDKAKEQFKQVAPMLKCFEYWFGPYPFYKDSYKLVESPHLGMEHQSAVAYGNGYQNGYKGNDLSGSGWGLKWDFIIVHESGHEWFANSITSKDIADMWIHESLTNYSETIYTGCQYGTEAGQAYVIGTRNNIRNDIPVIGPYGVNQEGSGDMYYKGGNMIHNIRTVINDDTLFRKILRGLNKEFYHQTVTTKQIEEYISKTAGKDFSKVFDQYLRTIKIPVLEYKTTEGKISFRWNNVVDGFNMPVKADLGGKTQWINPTTEWQSVSVDGYSGKVFKADKNFYITTKEVKE
ncbi:M1 family metallopeptidase [Pseudoflavitalea sp. G-6-1-2]|uniref:M1 family metallopeptidase n=1 Tax=Pseudoflavitalea sp. G-6-1-2 TaxID=2728841 RepID=UPI00146AA73F|nr:M1 family metallopeptidase [Pseudoflavitalea sp. G-6-1-2]NML23453.1 M1 family metallopeptidase [Pseudoflavitalea sp. G-6-1-2]